MKPLILDFESYFDDDYSLRKMTPVEYILDPRWETQGLAVKEGLESPSYWVDGPDVGKFFAQANTEVCCVTHNALFDMCICAWRYGWHPALMVDTLGVARAKLSHLLPSLSLEKVAKHLGLGVKGNALLKVKGLRFDVIRATPHLYNLFVEYGKNDADLCAGIFNELVVKGKFPREELMLMHMIIRAATQPQFELDQNVLAAHLHKCQQQKEHLLTQAMLAGVNGKSDLMSNDKFAELLWSHGVEPPTKISPTTGKTTYAFAKTDQGLAELREHENVAVQVLVEARLGHKSTLEETRTERLLAISRLQWPVTSGSNGASMPIPLRYSGAHTHRLSGDWKLNLQNLPRGGELRRALTAPKGKKVVAVDSSQIEARMVAFLSGCDFLLEAFENKQDVYSLFATSVFGRTITKANVPERFVGKQAILGLGYGLGWPKFQKSIKADSRKMTGQVIDLDDIEAQRIVNTYRSDYKEIPTAWRRLTNLINTLAAGGETQFGPVIFRKQEIILPSGLSLHYHNLYQADGQWLYMQGVKPKRLYGGALMENISQALARIVVMDAAKQIERRLRKAGIWLALQVHDELVYVVPDELVEVVKAIVLEEMHRRPTWGPNLPIAAEAGVGQDYAEAK